MRIILIASLLVLCSCKNFVMDKELSYSLYEQSKEGLDFSDEYKLRLKSRAVYFERKDKLRKYGYKLKNSTFFVEFRFPF